MTLENVASRILASESFKRDGVRPYVKVLSEFKDRTQLQQVHTPFDLCSDILTKVLERTNLNNSEILVLFNLEFVEVLISQFGVNPSRITFAADSEKKRMAAANWFKINTCTVTYSKAQGAEIMPDPKKKFDVIVMNPPYQGATKDDQKTGASAIWPNFVELSLNLCKEDGHIAAVHPAGWRGNGNFAAAGDKLKSKQIEYLEIHDMNDGVKTFGASTRYDWYVLQNKDCSHKTKIKDQHGKLVEFDLHALPIVPNFDIPEVTKLLAKDGEEKVEVIHSFSAYFSRKMSPEKTAKYKYPCVKYISKEGEVDLYWSSYKGKGHYGVKKVMFCIDSASGGGIVVDREGEYLLSQFVAGIVDSERNLNSIKKALESEAFREIMRACQYTKGLYNHNIIALFRKDFWKEFI